MAENKDVHPHDARPPRALLAACVIIALQVLALVAAAIVVVVKAATQTSSNFVGALLLAAIALIAAAVLVMCARGLLRLRPAARTPVVVLELLSLPVAYSLAFQANRVGYGGPILVAALAVLYLLFTPPVRSVLDRADRKPG
ncbi:MAG TPA: hypothetical protein VKB75_01680 [Jatrophihabitans sp.]|nr:hypothetical protein [Jatrophihabitans sp.]